MSDVSLTLRNNSKQLKNYYGLALNGRTNVKQLTALLLFIALAFSLLSCQAGHNERLNHLPANAELTREQAAEYILAAAGHYRGDLKKEDVIYTYPRGTGNGKKASRVETLTLISRAFGGLPEVESVMQTVNNGFGMYQDMGEWPLAADAIAGLYSCGALPPDYPSGDGLLHGGDNMTAGELRRLLRYAEALYKSDKIPASVYSPEDTWAVYWYICGSDLESEQNDASNDIAELLKVELPENITVVIEAGGAVTISNCTEFRRAKLPDGTYILAFRMTDVRGDSFSSAGVLMDIAHGRVTVRGIVE